MIKQFTLTTFIMSFCMTFTAVGQTLTDSAKNLPQAGEKIIQLIETGNYTKAESEISLLISNYSGDGGLSKLLYSFCEKFEYANRYEEAKRVFRQIATKYPDYTYTKIGIAREEILNLIYTQNYDEAQIAINKLISDFSANPDLPNTLYWIAEKYRWEERYEEAKRTCRKIIDKYPDSPWADRARLGYSRALVLSYISSQEVAGAKDTLDKLIVNFSANPDLPETLDWIAEKHKWSLNFQESKRVYQLILDKYPNSKLAGKARAGISALNTMSAAMAQDYNQPEETISKLAADSADANAQMAILIVGEQYYKEGIAKQGNRPDEKSMVCFEKASKIWSTFIDKFPDSTLLPEAYVFAADCYSKLGKNQEAIRCFKILTDKYPKYEYAWYGYLRTGQIYETQRQSGALSQGQADPLVIGAYESLVTQYGNCPRAKDAWRAMGHLHAESQRWTQAIDCYEAYMTLISEARCPTEVIYELAKSYDKAGDLDSARKMYEKYVRLTMPNEPKRKEVRERLSEI